jgi:hypothetical protein
MTSTVKRSKEVDAYIGTPLELVRVFHEGSVLEIRLCLCKQHDSGARRQSVWLRS